MVANDTVSTLVGDALGAEAAAALDAMRDAVERSKDEVRRAQETADHIEQQIADAPSPQAGDAVRPDDGASARPSGGSG